MGFMIIADVVLWLALLQLIAVLSPSVFLIVRFILERQRAGRWRLPWRSLAYSTAAYFVLWLGWDALEDMLLYPASLLAMYFPLI